VVHVTSAHSRDDVRIFLKECRSLARMGHNVTLLVADGLGPQEIDTIKIVDVGSSKSRLSRMLHTRTRLLTAALALKADVYHLHDPELLTLCAPLKRNGYRVLFDAHEDVPKQILSKHYLPESLRGLIAWVYARYENHVCSRIDGIVAATPTIRDKFLTLAPNTVDVNNFPLLGELDAQPTSQRGSGDICYVGGIAPIRGIREIIKAITICKQPAHLHLVGEFTEPAVEDEIKRSEAWRRVTYWGRQDREGVRSVLARSRIGLVTLHPTANYIDALPIKLFEYMAAGIPVIASDFPLWRSIVSSADCGICVDPLKPEDIASAIDILLAQSSKARLMGENGRRAVHERFNWEIEEEKLRAMYSRLQRRKDS
jgi:glycosyltransferase involved in cell wall biosynthesis